jgi:aspartate/methionine/tyrosine aminotransferase
VQRVTSALRLASRTEDLGTEAAYLVLEAAQRLEAAGRHVVHLEIGEPDTPTPPHIIEAGVQALRDGHTRYAVAPGIKELRVAIAESLAQRGLRVGPEHVVVTAGAKPALFYAMFALIEPGDEVLCPDPGFPIYESVVRLAGGRPVLYPLDAERGFAPDVDAIAERVTPRTGMLVLNVPHNPTGGVSTPADDERLAELAQRHDLAVLSDEVYSQIRYEGVARSIAALPGMAERTVVVDAFSKTYAMTGWRLGYGVMPVGIVDRVTTLLINAASCTATFVQHAGIAALRGPQDPMRRMVTTLKAKRDLMVSGLGKIEGMRCPRPAGAFYAFPSVAPILERAGLNAQGLADRLLADYGTAVLAGTAFGPGGEGHLRLSFATSQEQIELGLERIARCVTDLRTSAVSPARSP